MSVTGGTQPLAYASTVNVVRPRVAFYRTAIVCAIIPQAVAVTILAMYAWTRRSEWPGVGFLWLFGGFLVFLTGCGFFGSFVVRLRRCETDVRRAWARRVTGATLLLLSNLLAALGCVVVGSALTNEYLVVVTNNSNAPVTNIVLTGPDDVQKIPRLAPGESRRLNVTIDSDGEISYTATHNAQSEVGVVDGYVTHGGASRADLTFTNNGAVVTPTR